MSRDPVRDNEEYLVLAETRALKYILKYPDKRHEFRPSLFIHSKARTLYESINELLLGHADTSISLNASAIAQIANTKDSTLSLDLVKRLLFNSDQDFEVSHGDKSLILEQLSLSEARARVVSGLEEALEFASKPSVPDEDFFTQVGNLTTQVQTDAMSRGGSPLITMGEAFDMYSDELDTREKGGIHLSGDILLDKALTRKTAGGQIILLAGATGSGKSLYSLNLMNGFINLDIPAIYVTLEMDLISSMDRLAALRTGIPIDDWYDPDKIVTLRGKLRKEKESIGHSRVEIIEDPSLGLADIDAITSEFRAKHGIPSNERVVVVLDLITQVKDFAGGKNKGYSMASNYETAINACNVYVKRQNVCLIGTAQYNRNADTVDIQGMEDLRKTIPTLNDIKNSHALAERSRVVLSIWRPKYYMERYMPDAEETAMAEDLLYITVLKQSQGAVGKQLVYAFDGARGRILPTSDSVVDAPDGEEASVLRQVHF